MCRTKAQEDPALVPRTGVVISVLDSKSERPTAAASSHLTSFSESEFARRTNPPQFFIKLLLATCGWSEKSPVHARRLNYDVIAIIHTLDKCLLTIPTLEESSLLLQCFLLQHNLYMA